MTHRIKNKYHSNNILTINKLRIIYKYYSAKLKQLKLIMFELIELRKKGLKDKELYNKLLITAAEIRNTKYHVNYYAKMIKINKKKADKHNQQYTKYIKRKLSK